MASSQTSTSRRLRLYALGSNGNGQLGLGHEEDVDHPQLCCFREKDGIITKTVPLDDDEEISKIVAGGNHSLLLTSKGRLWATGSNLEGQRGRHAPGTGSEQSLGHAEEWQEFRLENQIGQSSSITSELIVTDVAATFSASFIVVGRQHVYSFGTGTKGELGLRKDTSNTMSPRLCFDLSSFETISEEDKIEIASISACMSHVVVLSSTGSIFGWGASRKGQLGESLRDEKTVWVPTKLDLDIPNKAVPSHILTGRDFTFVLLQESDRKFELFLGDASRLGIDFPLSICKLPTGSDFDDQAFSDVLSLEDAQSIQVGWTTIAILMKGNIVHTFGNTRRSVVSATMHDVTSIAAGSEHCIGLTDQGQVLAWGWGEHGNCGSNVDRSKNVRDRPNVIFDHSGTQDVVAIAAGCATSFFWTREISA